MEFSRRVNEILLEWDKSYLSLLSETDEYRYIDISVLNKDFFNYIPKSKIKHFEGMSEDDILNSNLRDKYAVDIKCTKLMNKILKETITTEQAERLLAITKKYEDYQFHIVSGEEIKKYYLKENYESDCKMLHDSCMNGKEKQEYLDFYVDNAELLILKNIETGKIVGRALVWKALLDGKEIEFMDRIYGDNMVSFKFTACAIKNNFYFRNSSNSCIFHYEDKIYYAQDYELILPIGLSEYKYMPYMDTFFIQKKNCLSAQDCYETFQNAVGGFVYCQKCGKKVYSCQENLVYSYDLNGRLCEDCCDSHKVEINGKFYRLGNNDLRWCYTCKKYYLKSENKRYGVCDKCWDEKYIRINGRKYSKKGKKVYFDENDKTWKLIENIKERC